MHYHINLTLSGNDTQLISAGNMTTGEGMFNITVTQVLGTNFTFYFVAYNGTQLTDAGTVELDVDSGNVNSSTTQIFLFVGANLAINDPVYTSQAYNLLRINSTIQTDYLGVMRDTNYMHVKNQYTNTNFFGIIANQTIEYDFYWDKVTGIETRAVNDVFYNRSDGSGGILMVHQKTEFIVISTSSVIPEFSLPIVLAPFVSITLVIVAFKKC